MKNTAIVLGLDGVVAQLITIDKDDSFSGPHKLILFQRQIIDEHVCAPAQSVEIYGAAAIIALRDALVSAYPIYSDGSLSMEELAPLRLACDRYETARRMNPRQWASAWDLNTATGKPFDEIIDDMRSFMMLNVHDANAENDSAD